MSKLAPDCTRCPVRARHFEGPAEAATLEKLAAIMVPRSYRDGQTIFIEGHGAEQVLFLRSGAARLTRLQAGGAELLLDFVGPGAVLGVEALFEGEHSATAVASGTLDCCAASATTLRAMLPANPGISLALLRMLRDDLDGLRSRVAELASWSAEQRVAHFLVSTLPLWHSRVSKFTQADMARSLALTPETLCRVLGEFRQRAWVRGSGRGLSVVAPAQLSRLAAVGSAG